MSNSAFSQNAPASSFADLTGVPDDNAALAAALAAKADAVNVPTVYKAIASGTTPSASVINQLGVTFTLSNASTGVYAITADSGSPFTPDKTFAMAYAVGDGAEAQVGYHGTCEYIDGTLINFFFSAKDGLPADPAAYCIQIEVYP